MTTTSRPAKVSPLTIILLVVLIAGGAILVYRRSALEAGRTREPVSVTRQKLGDFISQKLRDRPFVVGIDKDRNPITHVYHLEDLRFTNVTDESKPPMSLTFEGRIASPDENDPVGTATGTYHRPSATANVVFRAGETEISIEQTLAD